MLGSVLATSERCVCGGAGGFGGVMMGAGGRGTDCGVIKRGAGFASTAGAAVVLAAGAGGAGAAGLGATADGGATVVCGGEGGVGRGGAAGCAARCVIAFSTSPGLEMCDRSIFGLNSSADAAGARVPRLGAGDSCAKNFLTLSASSSSIELECVFFSVMPILGRTSRISLLLTSSSRARSLIRTLCCITPRLLRFVPLVKPACHPHGQLPVASGQWSVENSVALRSLSQNPESNPCPHDVRVLNWPLTTGHWPLPFGFSSSGTFSFGVSSRS